jgi:hypothetical protein
VGSGTDNSHARSELVGCVPQRVVYLILQYRASKLVAGLLAEFSSVDGPTAIGRDSVE